MKEVILTGDCRKFSLYFIIKEHHRVFSDCRQKRQSVNSMVTSFLYSLNFETIINLKAV